jgi:hypothetical protein
LEVRAIISRPAEAPVDRIDFGPVGSSGRRHGARQHGAGVKTTTDQHSDVTRGSDRPSNSALNRTAKLLSEFIWRATARLNVDTGRCRLDNAFRVDHDGLSSFDTPDFPKWRGCWIGGTPSQERSRERAQIRLNAAETSDKGLESRAGCDAARQPREVQAPTYGSTAAQK